MTAPSTARSASNPERGTACVATTVSGGHPRGGRRLADPVSGERSGIAIGTSPADRDSDHVRAIRPDVVGDGLDFGQHVAVRTGRGDHDRGRHGGRREQAGSERSAAEREDARAGPLDRVVECGTDRDGTDDGDDPAPHGSVVGQRQQRPVHEVEAVAEGAEIRQRSHRQHPVGDAATGRRPSERAARERRDRQEPDGRRTLTRTAPRTRSRATRPAPARRGRRPVWLGRAESSRRAPRPPRRRSRRPASRYRGSGVRTTGRAASGPGTWRTRRRRARCRRLGDCPGRGRAARSARRERRCRTAPRSPGSRSGRAATPDRTARRSRRCATAGTSSGDRSPPPARLVPGCRSKSPRLYATSAVTTIVTSAAGSSRRARFDQKRTRSRRPVSDHSSIKRVPIR